MRQLDKRSCALSHYVRSTIGQSLRGAQYTTAKAWPQFFVAIFLPMSQANPSDKAIFAVNMLSLTHLKPSWIYHYLETTWLYIKSTIEATSIKSNLLVMRLNP